MAALTLAEVEITVREDAEGFVAEIRRKGAVKHFQPAGTHTRVFVVTLGTFDSAEDAEAGAKASVEAQNWEN